VTTSAQPLLDVRNLSLSIGGARILKNVSVAVQEGESVGIVGPNGAGKTTLLRAVSGMYSHHQSTVATFDGAPLPKTPARAAKSGMMHVPEGRRLIPSLSVEENMRAACYAVGKRYTGATRASMQEIFPVLSTRAKIAAGLLSGGEQQMVAVARAVTVRPRMLLIDEMSLGLSPAAIANVIASLQKVLASGDTTMLIVDQNIRTVTTLCTRVYGLDQGTTVEYRDHDSLVADAVRDVYLF
jgi:branched-chain amino acid transport system ATP-binding protein